MANDALSALFDDAQEPFKKSIVCELCGSTCRKTGGKQRFCSDCREEGNRKLQREYDLERRQPSVVLGEIISCADCGKECERRGPTQTVCCECRQQHRRETGKRSRAKRLRTNCVGDLIQCASCGTDILKSMGGHKFCEPCAEQSKLDSTAASKGNPANIAKSRERNREWLRSESGREWQREYNAIPRNRVHSNMSRAMRACLNNKGGRSWEQIVGYSKEALMAHLEKQFLPGMTWDNYGEWHIDHVRPKVSFSFSSEGDDEFLECWSLSNLQPLWAEDNQKKSDIYLGVSWRSDRPTSLAA